MPGDHTKAWKRERENLEEADIPERDREAIRKVVEKAKADGRAESSLTQYVNHLRVTSRRSVEAGHGPLVELDPDALDQLMTSFGAGTHPDVKDEGVTLQGYHIALRKLVDAPGVFVPFDKDDVGLNKDTGRSLDPDDLLFRDDVDALLDACGMDVRYKALITWGLAAGQRLDAIRTVRIKHISWDGAAGTIQLNTDEAALKGASGGIPLLWARHYLRQWLDVHPAGDDPEAAVFCPDPRLSGNGLQDEPYEPLSQTTIRNRLKRLAERAGIEKNVYPHLLRHSAITRMVVEGVSEQQIKSVTGWAADSSEFQTYVNLADELRNDALRESLGLPTSDSGTPVIGRPTLDDCPECGDRIPDAGARCPSCDSPLSVDAVAAAEADEKTREAYREVSQERLEQLQLLDDLLDDPEIQAMLAEQDDE